MEGLPYCNLYRSKFGDKKFGDQKWVLLGFNRKMLSLKSSITKQQSIFTKPKQQSKAATVASIKAAHLLAKKKKPFIDVEIMKEAMLVAADSLFDDFKNKTEILGAINMLQLSARTATRRIELIASNLEAKLANDVETCEFFSIQLDESTEAIDTAQLAISVKMVCLMTSLQKKNF
ncbi:dimer_Tnp_hAT domain-containing protein [Trichonephila clavipes]|nr:dimer_Tnp_hAT domain-containing protein [Trichonephila clavipes]